MPTKQITSSTAEKQELAAYVISVRIVLKYCFLIKVPNIEAQRPSHSLTFS